MPKQKEPLLEREITRFEQGAVALHVAMKCKSFTKCPDKPQFFGDYSSFLKIVRWSQAATVCLLVLTMFETPLWCSGSTWRWDTPAERCQVTGSEGKAITVELSGLFMLPIGYGIVIETILLCVVLLRLVKENRLHSCFKDHGLHFRSDAALSFDNVMLAIALADLACFMFAEGASFRVAHFVRFALAASIPTLNQLLVNFKNILVGITSSALFLVFTILIFAWLMALTFDDLETEGLAGPANAGFETFGNALYTSFLTMTTANLPAVVLPSYYFNRMYILLFIGYTALATVVFANAILAVVYSIYTEDSKADMKEALNNKKKGILASFDLIRERESMTQNGEPVVTYEGFKRCIEELMLFDSSIKFAHDEAVLHIVFDALDDDRSGMLTAKEFCDMCDVLQHDFCFTKRDGFLRKRFAGTRAGEKFKALMEKNTEHENEADLGYGSRFEGSPFDATVTGVVFLNVLWIIFQSVLDLNGFKEPPWFEYVDASFCLVYLLDAGFKLSYWSWSEYWYYVENRFDFVSTMILASAALLFFLPRVELSSDTLRTLNMLRLVRVLKALSNVAILQTTCCLIGSMLRTCSSVLAMNLLVVYMWACLGMLLFGGAFVDDAGKFHGHRDDYKAYFDSHFDAFNFNDIVSGMITLFYIMVGGWSDEITLVAVAVPEKYSFLYFASYAFFLSFYVVAPLLAFNVFTALSIDAFTSLSEMSEQKDVQSEVVKNLEHYQDLFSHEGTCLHITVSSALRKEKVFKQLYEEEDQESKPAEKKTSSIGLGGDMAVLRLQVQLQEERSARARAEAQCAQALNQLERNMEWMARAFGRIESRVRQ